MKATVEVLLADAKLQTLAQKHRWVVMVTAGDRRRHEPSMVIYRPGFDLVLAVFVRPRRLRPSEVPSAAALPASLAAVVWHPGMHREVGAWLSSPVADPPGLLERSPS